MLNRAVALVVVGAAIIAWPVQLVGGLITSQTGSTVTGNNPFFGQSVITPSGGPWDDISFNFYTNLASPTAEAVGNLFILTQSYSGTPTGLSSTTPGYVAESIGVSGGTWNFSSLVVLQPATTYYFMMGAQQQEHNSVLGKLDNSAATSHYFAGGVNVRYESNTNDLDFRLQGALVPEPTSIALAAVALASLMAWGRRHRKR